MTLPERRSLTIHSAYCVCMSVCAFCCQRRPQLLVLLKCDSDELVPKYPKLVQLASQLKAGMLPSVSCCLVVRHLIHTQPHAHTHIRMLSSVPCYVLPCCQTTETHTATCTHIRTYTCYRQFPVALLSNI